MLEWLRDENVTKYLQIDGTNSTIEDTLRFIADAKDESKNLHRAIVGDDDVYLGTISLKNIDHEKKEAEYAIAMHPSGMRIGAAKEASNMITQLASEQLGMFRVYLNVKRNNHRAVRLYDRLGYIYTHTSILDVQNSKTELLWYETKL